MNWGGHITDKASVYAKTSEPKKQSSSLCKQESVVNNSGSPAERILQLQRTAGNQAVQRLIGSGVLQAKLKIGQPNDSYEQEADRVAEQVMRMPRPQVQRKCAKCKKKLELLQPKAMGSITNTVPPIVHEALSSPGQPLDAQTRAFMEPRFGHDFGSVRVHSGSAAEQSARDVNANAYTAGNNIVFGAGRFEPGAREGRWLIAHELTHVLQQTGAGGGWATYPTAAIQREESEFNPIPNPENLASMYQLEMKFDHFDGIANRLLIAVRFQPSPFAYIIRVLKAVGKKKEDNLGAAFVKRLSDPELDRFASSSSGRHTLNVLYEAIITGDVSEFEREQANRIIMIKMRRLAPEDYLKSMKMTSSRLPTRIFPFRLMRVTPGYDYAPPNAKLLPNGKVWVNYPTRVLFMDTFKEELRTPIYQAFLSEGLQLNPNEIVGIKDYERGGHVNYLPALALIDYSNQAKQSTLGKIVEVSVFAATMGLGGGAAAGGRALAGEATAVARWGTRLVKGARALDRVADFIGIAHFVIDENRDWIISKFGKDGKWLVQLSDKANSIAGIYGIGRLSSGVGYALVKEMRAASRAVRTQTKGLTEIEAKVMQRLDEETDAMLKQLDEEASKAVGTAKQAEAHTTPNVAKPTRHQPPDSGKIPTQIPTPTKGGTPHVDPASGINDDTRRFFESKAGKQLKEALDSSPHATQALKACHSLCYPKFANSKQVKRIEKILAEAEKSGMQIDYSRLQQRLHDPAIKNAQDLDKAIDSLKNAFENQKQLGADIASKVEQGPSGSHYDDTPSAIRLRNSPGVASGGESLITFGEHWLQEGKVGLFPKQIADRMRGMHFNNFGEFRKTFWILVASDPALKRGWTPRNLSRMRNGWAPFVSQAERVGGGSNRVWQLDHKLAIKNGGEVYDFGNLQIVSPKFHGEVGER